MAIIRDLGTLEGPVLVFGGPYGNLEATDALLAEAARLDIPWDRVICTGDVAAYCADPQACVDRLRERGIPTVMGNCEEQLAGDAEDCGCGFGEDSACAALSVAWYAYCRAALDRSAKAWMGGLPHRLVFTLAGRRLAVVHGGVRVINRFIFASSPWAEKAAELNAAGSDGVVAGHCGLPFSSLVDGRLWHNAGAIGMPANDGTARVWFSLLAPKAEGILITRHSLAYDYACAMRKMRSKGLPEAYAVSLESGSWPSCDILPSAERRARGRPLAPEAVLWPAAEARRKPGQSRGAS